MQKKKIVRTSGYSDRRISEQPDIEIPGWPEIRISGCPEIRLLGNPDIWLAGNPDNRVLRHPDSRVSGSPDFCKSSPLTLVHFHLCAIYLNFSLEFKPAADICREPSQLS